METPSYLHQRVCDRCTTAFTTRYRRQRFCSDRCWFQARARTPRYPRWTDGEVTVLRQLAGQLPSYAIAARLGRTRAAVKAKAKEKGIKLYLYGERCPWAKHSDAVVEEARVLHDDGMLPRAIAERLGIPYTAVRTFVEYKRSLGYAIEH